MGAGSLLTAYIVKRPEPTPGGICLSRRFLLRSKFISNKKSGISFWLKMSLIRRSFRMANHACCHGQDFLINLIVAEYLHLATKQLRGVVISDRTLRCSRATY